MSFHMPQKMNIYDVHVIPRASKIEIQVPKNKNKDKV